MPTFGSGNSDQVEPSQCSAMLARTPLVPPMKSPTAQASVGEAAETAARLLSLLPMLGLGTCCHPPAQVSVVFVPFVAPPVAEIELSPFGGGVNGGGRVGMVVDPVTWNSDVIGVAVQAACRQGRPNASSRLASKLKWSKPVPSVTPRGPWLVITTVATVCLVLLPSSEVSTIALLPDCHTGEDVILLTMLPTTASPVAISQFWLTLPALPLSVQNGGAPCMSWHSSGTM